MTRYAISFFRADMPASNFLLGFPGRHGSVQPCSKCALRKATYDPFLARPVDSSQLSMFKGRKFMSSLNSAMTSLPPDDPLRLFRTALWTTQGENNRSNLIASLRNAAVRLNPQLTTAVNEFVSSEKFGSVMDSLVALIQLLPPITAVPFADSVKYYPEFKVPKEGNPCVQSRNGWMALGLGPHLDYDLTHLVGLPKESAVALDMMHAFHCLFDKLVGHLLQNPKLGNVTVQEPDVIEALSASQKHHYLQCVINQGLKRMGMTDEDIFYDELPASVKQLAWRRYLSVSQFPVNVRNWIKDLLEGHPPAIRAEEKMVFCRAILPFLFVDSMHHPCVWAIVTLLSVLSVIHNYEGRGKRLRQLGALVNTCLSVLELFVKPSFSSIYFHFPVHSVKSYLDDGPPKDCDTLHPESLYCSTREEATGGKAPVQTMSHRLMMRMSALLLSFGCEEKDELVTRLVFDDLLPHLESLSMKADFLRLFSLLNFVADSARFDNDLFPQVTVLDLTLNGMLESFLAGEWEGDPYQQYRGIESHHAVSHSDLREFYGRVVGKRRFGWTDYSFWSEVTWGGVHYGSCGCRPCELKKEKVERGCFGVVYDCFGRSHLFLVYGYVGVFYEGELYIQAIGFELESVSAIETCETPFAFSVDLTTLKNNKQPPALISLHRLVVDELFITGWTENVVYFGVSAVCLRQWKLIKRVMQIPSESVLGELKHHYE